MILLTMVHPDGYGVKELLRSVNTYYRQLGTGARSPGTPGQSQF